MYPTVRAVSQYVLAHSRCQINVEWMRERMNDDTMACKGPRWAGSCLPSQASPILIPPSLHSNFLILAVDPQMHQAWFWVFFVQISLPFSFLPKCHLLDRLFWPSNLNSPLLHAYFILSVARIAIWCWKCESEMGSVTRQASCKWVAGTPWPSGTSIQNWVPVCWCKKKISQEGLSLVPTIWVSLQRKEIIYEAGGSVGRAAGSLFSDP